MPSRKPRWALPQPRSIAARLALTFVAAGVALTMAMTYVVGAFFQNHLETQASATLPHLAQQVAAKLSRELAERADDLETVAASELLTTAQATVEARRDHLEKTRETLGLAWLAFIDPAGQVLAASGGHLEGTSVAGASWFTEGLTRLHVGRDLPFPALAAALEEGSRFLPMALPVRDPQGRVVGVLGAQQYLSYLRAGSPLPATALQEGIVAHIYSGESGGAERRWLMSSGGTSGKAAPPAPITSKKLFHWRETHDGVDYLMGFGRSSGYRDVPGPAWLVAVRQPTDRAFAPVATLRGRILGWGLGLTLLCAIPLALYARRLGRRLRSVASSAERIRSGETLAVMPVFPGRDELARMSVSVAALVEELRPREPAAGLPPRAPAEPPASDRPAEYVRPAGTDPRRVSW